MFSKQQLHRNLLKQPNQLNLFLSLLFFKEEGDTPLINAKQGDQKSDMFLSTHAQIVNSVNVVAFQSLMCKSSFFLLRKNQRHSTGKYAYIIYFWK